MSKQTLLLTLFVGAIVSPSSTSAVQRGQQAAQCLHGQSETPGQRARREEALAVATQINRAEQAGPTLPRQPRTYRPLADLWNVPPTPAGFRLQFHTDGRTYAFSLKDTMDSCHYAIFSDQDLWIYEATPRRTGVRVVPAEVP
jgi:hypothetical protein